MISPRAISIAFSSLFLAIAIVIVCGSTAMAISADAPAGATDQKTSVCQGAGLAGGGSDCTDGSTTINDVIKTVINILSVIVGVAAVIMIMVGGFKYVTSGGAPEQISSAKNTVFYAVIGLVVVALSQIIVRFVLAKLRK